MCTFFEGALKQRRIVSMAKNKRNNKSVGSGDASSTANATMHRTQSSGLPTVNAGHPLLWIIAVLALSGLCLSPMLSNQFTNWDDLFYVINNKLLVGPDYKGIFDVSQPVVSNYHPLTVLSLAWNYQSSQLNPSSYLMTNLILHLLNTALVFWFVFKISNGHRLTALFCAVIFGIHPMHVESVAWVSERKDVLYTLFFLLSLISYWEYLLKEKSVYLAACLILFVLSLLSKPAAIVLPLVLVLLDYYKGRPLVGKALLEKIPAFVLSLIFAFITLKIQSAKAVSSLESISLAVRPLFAAYAVMTYFVRFFVPYPLSTYHPYPPMDNLGPAVYGAPLVVAALAFMTWKYRKDKDIVFGMLFYLVNLLLVLQLVSFGNTIVSERYTYVPYIGLAFMLAQLASRMKSAVVLMSALTLSSAAIFGYMSFERTKVWHDSETLWTDVIAKYPYTSVPRTNRANHVSSLAGDPAYATRANAMNLQSLGDCDTALRVDPKHAAGYRIRGIVLLRLNRPAEALQDAIALKRLMPDDPIGYTIGGTANLRTGHADDALLDFNKALQFNPDDADVLNSRGTTLFNLFKKYPEALADFNHALTLKQDGGTYLNRSRCYYMMGDMEKARQDVRQAQQLKTPVDAGYAKLVGL